MERNKQKKTTSISTDGGYRLWHSSTGNKLPQNLKKNNYIYSTLSLEKTKDLYKALMQISKNKRRKKIYNNKKENKNNNWAPSKIRLRLGAEVDKNYNNSKS